MNSNAINKNSTTFNFNFNDELLKKEYGLIRLSKSDYQKIEMKDPEDTEICFNDGCGNYDHKEHVIVYDKYDELLNTMCEICKIICHESFKFDKEKCFNFIMKGFNNNCIELIMREKILENVSDNDWIKSKHNHKLLKTLEEGIFEKFAMIGKNKNNKDEIIKFKYNPFFYTFLIKRIVKKMYCKMKNYVDVFIFIHTSRSFNRHFNLIKEKAKKIKHDRVFFEEELIKKSESLKQTFGYDLTTYHILSDDFIKLNAYYWIKDNYRLFKHLCMFYGAKLFSPEALKLTIEYHNLRANITNFNYFVFKYNVNSNTSENLSDSECESEESDLDDSSISECESESESESDDEINHHNSDDDFEDDEDIEQNENLQRKTNLISEEVVLKSVYEIMKDFMCEHFPGLKNEIYGKNKSYNSEYKYEKLVFNEYLKNDYLSFGYLWY